MQKIISLFCRNYETDHRVRDEIVPGAEWVADGEGVATRKWDGTCCMIRDGKLFKRYDAKAFTIGNDGQRQPWNRTPPEGFEAAQEPDETTGHWPGWVPVGDKPEDRWFREAFALGHAIGDQCGSRGLVLPLDNGTYELCGPKINANPDNLTRHTLLRHGVCQYPDCPRTFGAIREWLSTRDIEGIVWHHPDGRMVKIKTKDFGLKRQRPQPVTA